MPSAVLDPVLPSRPRPSRPSFDDRHPAWPLTVLFLGFPVWWLLGFSSVVAMVLAIPMALQLRRKRLVVVPNGFGWWVLFLLWVAIGVLALWTDAPGAVPGGGPERLLVFAYRFCWYVTCTVVLVWMANTTAQAVTLTKVANLVGWLFVFAVVGGLLGVLLPALELRSALELVLPRGLTSNNFVRSMVHPGVADVQLVLGRPEARPKAPFAFANSWGSNLSLTLPFFLLGWWRRGRPWQRAVAPLVLVASAVPVVYSLNRGLWISLLIGAAFLVLLQIRRGRLLPLLGSVLAIPLCFLLLLASPLGTLVSERLDNQHSNDRRSQLLAQTLVSAATGSPVIGFGSTRDVQGSFSSIAGASTPDCKACGVPPLGTQGHLWLVVFSQGIVGAGLFLVFFLVSFARSWRCRSPEEALATCVLLFFGFQLLVYDTLGMPLLVVMLALGLGWRTYALQPGTDRYRVQAGTLRAYATQLWSLRRLFVVLAVVGLLAGALWAHRTPQVWTARERVYLAPSPIGLVTGVAGDQAPQETTIDTDAALVSSEATLQAVAGSPTAAAELRDRIVVTAEPSTSVLVLSVQASSAEEAEQTVRTLADTYLRDRESYLNTLRAQVVGDLRDRYGELSTLGFAPSGDDPASAAEQGAVVAEMQSISDALTDLAVVPVAGGRVVGQEPATLSSRNYVVTAASGAGLALLAGVALMLVRPFTDRLRRLVRRRPGNSRPA